jgi:long-subunit fatty acid transport protein
MVVMVRKIKFLAVLLLAFCVFPVLSQSILGLQYPFGIPLTSGTGTSLSMGGTGIAIANDFLGITENPANLGNVNRAVFSLNASLDIMAISQNDAHSTHLNFNPNLLSFSFPLAKFGSFGFSFAQLSDADATYKNESSLLLSGLSTTSKFGYIRDGNTNAWQLGWGYAIKNYAKIGLSYERLYFNSNTLSIKMVEGAVNDSLNDSTRMSFHCNGLRAGVQIPLKNLTLGFSGEYIFKSEATQYREIKGTRVDSNFAPVLITSKRTSDITPPPSFGIGAAYQIRPELLAALDFQTTFWSKYHSDISDIPFGKAALNNAYNFSIGTQFTPAPNLLTPKYYEIVQYRAGFRYTQLPVSTASEFGLSLGAGLPLKEGGGLFDIFLEYGRRWDSNVNNYSENIFKIQIGFNAGRKWYQSAEASY